MALPVTVPNAFANASASIPLSQLDANFDTLSNAVNGIANGVETLANVQITGGNIDNVAFSNVVISEGTLDNLTLSNVTVTSGNVTVTDIVCTTANVTTGNITTVNATTVNTTDLDLTNIEVTNIKAKDGTAAMSIADSTGKISVTSELAVDNLNFSLNTIASTNTNGDIFLTPDGSGEVNISKVDIDSGAIDGTTIGGSSPAVGTFTTANATTVDTTNIEVTNIKAKDGTAAASIADSTGKITVSTELAVDNLNFSGNAITSTNTNGNIALTPNGTGEVDISKVDIAGGEIDAVTLGTNSAVTEAQIDNINIDGNTISTTDTDGDLILSPDGDGVVQEEVGGTNYNLASQYDIGTAPNEIPLNQYLGDLAYQNAGSIAGPVVIGTQTSSAALRITQTGTGNALVVEDSANPDATPFVINSTGTVLIGVDSKPAFSSHSIQQHGNTGATSSLTQGNWSTNQSFGVENYRLKSLSGTVGTQTPVISGAVIGRERYYGDDGTTFIEAAQIAALVDGTPGTNDMPGRLVFSTTADGASSPTERVRIKSNGSVRFQPMSQPASAEAGDVYYDSGTNKLRCYNGSTWNDLF